MPLQKEKLGLPAGLGEWSTNYCKRDSRKNGNDEHDGTKSRSRKHEEH